MAKLYGEIAAKSLLTLDKSFARANGQPLDASEVYYSLEAAKTYAATAQAYIGQKIVVIEDGVVSHYSVEDTNGTLKELGSKPVADGTTVAIGEDGKITLANITAAEAIGTYNAVLVNGKLSWVKPSETTVEGLSDLISALTGRVDAAEADIDALESDVSALENAVGVAAKEAVGEEGDENYEPAVAATGLFKAITDEAARADAAEKALGERIDAIDFVDEDELAEAIKDFATDSEVAEAVKVAKDRADEAYALAESKVDSKAYAADKKALQDEDAEIREIAEAAKARIDTFMDEEGIADVVDSLKDIKDELDKMADATDMVEALALKADKSYVDEELGKKANASDVETAFALKADKSYVDEELGKKQDVIAENTYDAYGSAATAKSEAIADAEGKIATAKQEAIDAAATAAAELYATKVEVSELETNLDARLDILEAIDHSLYATNEALAPVKQTADNAAAKVETLEDKIEEITSVGGEPNVIDYVKVNGTILEVEKDAEGKSTKTVNVIVPTKVSDLTDDSGFSGRIDAAQSAADAAQGTANEAKSKAETAQSEVDALEGVVGGIQTTVASHTTSIADYGTRIGALEQADITHATEYSTLSGIVSGHTESIAKKADASALEATNAKVSANDEAIKAINETTIPALETKLQGNIDKKANASDVYTKSEIDAITGDVADGKTIVDMIEDAKAAATYDDTDVKADIKANADAIAILNGDVSTTGSVKAEAKAAADAAVAAVVDSAPEAMDTLKEVADWIANDETGAAAMAADISGNKAAIAAINDSTTGILAVAKKYTDDSIAGLPAATAEALGLVKYDDDTIKMNDDKQLYVAKVSTDVLVQGVETLVLNGGTANA